MGTQGCSETAAFSNKQCGTRSFDGPAQGLAHGEASPGEFPWTCLLLNQNNDFIGSCAIIPNDFSNNNNRGTRKVITAAHKLKKIGERDLLKVRVGEYDASGFNDPERFRHEEYTVTRLLKHPQFNPGRLDNDIAILYVERDIDLSSPHVKTSLTTSSVTVLGSDAGLPAGGRMNLTVLSSSFNTKWIFHWLIMHRAIANLRLPLTSRGVVLVTGSI